MAIGKTRLRGASWVTIGCWALGSAVTVTAGPIEPPPRQRATVFEIDGAAYFLGGVDPDSSLNKDEFFNDVWEFSQGDWDEVPDVAGDDGPPTVQGAPAAATLEGDGLVFPGFDTSGVLVNDVLFFLAASGAFFSLDLQHPDGLGGATVATGLDHVFLAGGFISQVDPPASTARLFDLRSDSFGFVDNLIQLSEVVGGAAGFFSPLHQVFGLLFGSDGSFDPSSVVQVVENAIPTGAGSVASIAGGDPTVHVTLLVDGPGIPVARTAQASAARGSPR